MFASGVESSFDVLASGLKDDPVRWQRLADSVRVHTARLDEEERRCLEALVYADVFSEYDARHLSTFVRTLDVELTDHFWACERHWKRDEELHYLGFRAAYGALVDRAVEDIDAELGRRRYAVDFGPIADLFEDELAIACLMAYDELATVRAYRSGFERYARLGPELSPSVRQVTADELRHFRNFVKLVRQEHAHRLDEVGAGIDRIRAREGTAYANTFVLDHDDDVWSESIFDEAAQLLRRRLRAH